MNAPMVQQKLELKDPSLLRFQCYVDGQWCDADSKATIPVVNPANGAMLGTIPRMGTDETRRAIEAANTAWPAWRKKTGKERAAVLRKWFELMMANQEDLARIMTAEQGKPLAEASGEIAYAASFLEWFAEEGKRIYGDVMPHPQGDKRIVVLKQPVGVVGAITPWNFPNAMIARKAAPALAAGCAFVVKPAEKTPLSALALAVLAARAGLPDGILSVLPGTDAAGIGLELCTNPKVRKLTFTGSTEVGRILMRQCAHDLKKLSLELGGNAPLIVFEDAAMDQAVAGAIAAKYRNSGQTCVCANRILVHRSLLETFAVALAEATARLRVGDGMQEGVDIGPLVDGVGLAKVEDHVADAVAKGARVLVGGSRVGDKGNFYSPTVLIDIDESMRIMSEETFGPVAPIIAFDSEDQAIKLANSTEFGLASYIFTRDLARAWRVSEALEAGMVGINTGLISTAEAPFGGIKSSGIGREGSKYGIDDYLELKYLCLQM